MERPVVAAWGAIGRTGHRLEVKQGGAAVAAGGTGRPRRAFLPDRPADPVEGPWRQGAMPAHAATRMLLGGKSLPLRAELGSGGPCRRRSLAPGLPCPSVTQHPAARREPMPIAVRDDCSSGESSSARNAAVDPHEAGSAGPAAAGSRAAPPLDPAPPEALYRSGLLAHQAGRPVEALGADRSGAGPSARLRPGPRQPGHDPAGAASAG